MEPVDLREAYEERVRSLSREVASRDLWLATLSAVATRTHDSEDEAEILDISLSEVLTRFDLRAAWVFMGRQEERKLRFAASRGVSRQYLQTVEVEGLEECLCPEVFWTGHRMQARNTTQCPRMPTIIDGLRERTAHACVPLRFEGGTRGVLNIAAKPGQLFTEEELAFFETLGHQMCVAIERAGHLRAERRRNLEARALSEMIKLVGASLDLREVLDSIGRSAREILGADRVCVLLGDDPRKLRAAHLSGLPHPDLAEGDTVDLVRRAARGHQWALKERSLLQVDDWRHDPRVNNELAVQWDFSSAILAPLVARDRTFGLLALTRRERRPWTPSEVDLASSFAAQACVAIENARLYEDARRALADLTEAQGRILESQKMAVLGTFASGLAHEVRNPLNSISLQLAVLERRMKRLESPVAAEMQDLADIIRGEISRLDALVGDFLLFSRTARLLRGVHRLDDLAEDVTRLLEPEGRELGISCEHQVAPGERAPGVMIDPERMKQVMINLVRNAFEAIGRDGCVTIRTEHDAHEVRFLVEDDGPGLPDGVDIFQLFVTTKARGTGLGLAIAQQIVSDHGGRIRAENRETGGARFVVSLPAAAGASPGDAV